MVDGGRISDVERAQRLHAIDLYNQDGLTDYEITQKMGVSINVVKRLQSYLQNLQKAEISPKELAEKRSELYLELTEASGEAKKLFDEYKIPTPCPGCKGIGVSKAYNKKTEIEYEIACRICGGMGSLHRAMEANKFFQSWIDTIEKKAKLYGLDNQKGDSVLQQFNFGGKYVPDIKIAGKSRELSERLAIKLKEDHENRVKVPQDDNV